MTIILPEVHLTCCDANLALCGTAMSGGTDAFETDGAVTCLLCLLADEQTQPCSAPGCEIGRDLFDADLEFMQLGQCRVCGCTDDTACPGGCSWVPDPDHRGLLCSACQPATTAPSPS